MSRRGRGALAMAFGLLAAAPVVSTPAQRTVLPDLRIVRMELTPDPLRDGEPAQLRLMLHNRSSAVAAGTIVVQASHDQRTGSPQPLRHEVLYMGPDAITEMTFDVPPVSIGGSPYTFYAVVDLAGALDEADEADNTAWVRASVCHDPGAAEVADGADNDCDGLVDEEVGLSPDPSVALQMLRALQRRALYDAAPLVYAQATVFAPSPIDRPVRIASEEGGYVGKPLPTPPGEVLAPATGSPPPVTPAPPVTPPPPPRLTASLTADDPGAILTLRDWNGGQLRSGDLVSLRDARGEAIVPLALAGDRLDASLAFRTTEALFHLIRAGGSAGEPIAAGDNIALVSFAGRFVSAEQGGGGPLHADRTALGGWETFTLTFVPEGEPR